MKGKTESWESTEILLIFYHYSDYDYGYPHIQNAETKETYFFLSEIFFFLLSNFVTNKNFEDVSLRMNTENEQKFSILLET